MFSSSLQAASLHQPLQLDRAQGPERAAAGVARHAAMIGLTQLHGLAIATLHNRSILDHHQIAMPRIDRDPPHQPVQVRARALDDLHDLVAMKHHRAADFVTAIVALGRAQDVRQRLRALPRIPDSFAHKNEAVQQFNAFNWRDEWSNMTVIRSILVEIRPRPKTAALCAWP